MDQPRKFARIPSFLVGLSLAVTGCNAKLTPETSSTPMPAAIASDGATSTETASDGNTSTETITNSATSTDAGDQTKVTSVVIDAVDANATDGKTITTGDLTGLVVSTADSPLDPSAKITVTLDPSSPLPLSFSISPVENSSARVTLPDALTKDVDVSHSTIFAKDSTGTISALPPSSVTVTDGAVTATVNVPGALAISDSTSDFQFHLPATSFTTDKPSLTWTASPLAPDRAFYNVSVMSPDCLNVVQTFSTSKLTASVPTALADGNYCLTLSATIDGGTLASTTTQNIAVDSHGPAPFTLTVPGSAITSNNLPTINWDVAPHSSETSVTYDLKRSSSAACTNATTVAQGLTTSSYTFTSPLADGSYYICLEAVDVAGNHTAATNNGMNLGVDTSPPAAFTFVGTGGNAYPTSSHLVSWNVATDLSAVKYDVKVATDAACSAVVQQSLAQSASSFNATTLADNLYYVCLEAKDALGYSRLATGSGTFTFRIDTTQPSAFSIAGTTGTATSDDTPLISWSASSDASTFSYGLKVATNSSCTSPEIDTTGLTSANYTPAVSLAQGTHYVCLSATDAAGNVRNATNSGTYTIVVDTLAPANFSITGPASTATSATPTIAWGAAADATVVNYVATLLDAACSASIEASSPQTGLSYVVTTTLLTAHTYCVRILATDAAGNTKNATNNSYTFTVDAPKPSSASGISVVPGDQQNAVSWTAGSGATGVIVVRKSGSAVTWTPTQGDAYGLGSVSGSEEIVYAGAGLNFTDSSLTNGTTYHYAIYSYNAAKAYSSSALTGSGAPTGGIPFGTMHVAFIADGNTAKSTSYTGSWTPAVVVNGSHGIGGLAQDSSNNLHLGLGTSSSGPRYYSTFNGTSWTIPQTAATITTTPGFDVAIATDSTGKVHYAYGDYNKLYYTNGTSASFTTPVLIHTAGGISVIQRISLVVDASDKVHIVFYAAIDAMGTMRSIYATNASGSWVETTSEVLNKNFNATSCMTANVADLAVDGAGKAHLVYNCTINVIYATNKTGSWVYEEAYNYADAWGSPKIALTSTGDVRMLTDDGSFITYCPRTNAGVWSYQNPSAYTGTDYALALDALNNPYLFIAGSNTIKLTSHNGSAWSDSTVVPVAGSSSVKLIQPVVINGVNGRSHH